MSMSFTTFSKLGLLVIAIIVTQLLVANGDAVRAQGRSNLIGIEEAFSHISFADRARADEVLTVQVQKDAWHAEQRSGSDAVPLVLQGAIGTGSGAFRSLNAVHELSHQTSHLKRDVSTSIVEIKTA